jgi:glycerate 2-kinase
VTKFDEHLRQSDLVITGEGKIDRQVQYGKALSGILERARSINVPVLAVAGKIEGDRDAFVHKEAFAGLESLVDHQISEADAMRYAPLHLTEKTKRLLQRYLSRT